MDDDLAIWRRALPGCDIAFDHRPDGSYVVIVLTEGKELRRVLPVDLKDVDQLIRRIKLDLMLAKGQIPTRDVIGTMDISNLPTYTNGRLYKTRAASLWERRRLKMQASSS